MLDYMEKAIVSKQIFNKTLFAGFGLLAYFFITAILGSIIGGYIDTRFEIEPMGTLGSMVVTYIISILLAIFYISKKGFFSFKSQ